MSNINVNILGGRMAYEVEADVSHEAQRSDRYGYANYTAAYLVALLAVVSSVVGAGLALFEANKVITAIAAFIPALVAALTKVFPFEQKALWHWSKAQDFWTIRRSLGVDAISPEQAVELMNDVCKKQYQGWVKLDPLLLAEKGKNGT
jgi:hypothetical protein